MTILYVFCACSNTVITLANLCFEEYVSNRHLCQYLIRDVQSEFGQKACVDQAILFGCVEEHHVGKGTCEGSLDELLRAGETC